MYKNTTEQVLNMKFQWNVTKIKGLCNIMCEYQITIVLFSGLMDYDQCL